MSTEALTFKFPPDIYDFLTTPDLELVAFTRSHNGETQPFVMLTREVVVTDETGLKKVSQSTRVFSDTLKILDEALFSGIADVVSGSPLAIAQQNFLAVAEALKKANSHE